MVILFHLYLVFGMLYGCLKEIFIYTPCMYLTKWNIYAIYAPTFSHMTIFFEMKSVILRCLSSYVT